MGALRRFLCSIFPICIFVAHSWAQINDFDVEYESESSEKRDEEDFLAGKPAPVDAIKQEMESNPENEGKLKPRISGGRVAPEFHNPAQLYIMKTEANEYGEKVTTFLCGATLVKAANIHIVVTAKSCIAESDRSTIPLELLEVVGGTNSREYTSIHTQRRFVQDASFPPHTEGDVAVLYINPDFLETRALRPVLLPKFENNPDNFINPVVQVSGWGKSGNESEVSDVLRYTFMYIISNKDCATTYGLTLGKNACCGLPTRGTSLISEGDKGGPVIARNRNTSEPELVGVIGDPVAGPWKFPKKPSIIHRTDPHVEWIIPEAYRFMATVLPVPDSAEDYPDPGDIEF